MNDIDTITKANRERVARMVKTAETYAREHVDAGALSVFRNFLSEIDENLDLEDSDRTKNTLTVWLDPLDNDVFRAMAKVAPGIRSALEDEACEALLACLPGDTLITGEESREELAKLVRKKAPDEIPDPVKVVIGYGVMVWAPRNGGRASAEGFALFVDVPSGDYPCYFPEGDICLRLENPDVTVLFERTIVSPRSAIFAGEGEGDDDDGTVNAERAEAMVDAARRFLSGMKPELSLGEMLAKISQRGGM